MYNVKRLGNIGIINDINNSGQMTGINPATNKATLYSDWQVAPLPLVAPDEWFETPQFDGAGGDQTSVRWEGMAINSSGNIVGFANMTPSRAGDTMKRAFLWSQGALVDLHKTLVKQFGYLWSVALDVNDVTPDGAVSVVGLGNCGPWLMSRRRMDASGLQAPAWEAFCLCQTSGLPQSLYEVILINNPGIMATSSDSDWYLSDATGAMRHQPRPPFPVADMSTYGSPWVQAINDRGEVLLLGGVDGFQLWLRVAGRNIEIGNASPEWPHHKRFLNNLGAVVYGIRTFGDGPALWLNNGSRVNLTQAIGSGDGVALYDVLGINDAGQIICREDAGVGENTVLLTPGPIIPPSHH